MPGIDRIEVSVLQPGDALTVFRVCRADRELVDAFISSYAANRPPRGWEMRNVIIQMGLSTFARRAQAEAVARRFPAIGDRVARVAARVRLCVRTHGRARARDDLGPATRVCRDRRRDNADRVLMHKARTVSASTWMLMDSSGNLIDSFDDEESARDALQRILKAHAGNAEHVALIGFDANGDPVAPPAPVQRRVV